MSESLNNRIKELEIQLNGSFTALVIQLQHSVDQNLSWSEGNITVNVTDQRQIELKNMSDTFQLIFQHQQDMLDQVHTLYILYELCKVELCQKGNVM